MWPDELWEKALAIAVVLFVGGFVLRLFRRLLILLILALLLLGALLYASGGARELFDRLRSLING